MPDYLIEKFRTDHLTCESSVRVSSRHTCFNGHFDNFPLLPAVAQLKLIQDLVEKSVKEPVHICAGNAIKFLQSIHPDDLLSVRIEFVDKDKITFTINKNNKPATKGQLQTSLIRDDA